MKFRENVGVPVGTFYFCRMKSFIALLFLLTVVATEGRSAPTPEPLFRGVALGMAGEKVDSIVAQADTVENEELPDSTKTATPSSHLYLPVAPCLSPIASWEMWGFAPWHPYGWGSGWRLREGFNAQLDLSMTAAFGRHAPGGVGFGQNISLAYAKTLDQRWAVAVGLNARNMDWGSFNRQEAGMSAVVRYQASDWLNLYGYAFQKLTPSSRPLFYGFSPYYGMESPDTRIGAAAEIKLGKNAVLNMSVDWVRYETDDITPLMERPTYKRNNY